VAAPIAAAAAQLAAAALQKLQMATSPAPVSPAPVSPAPVSTTPAAAPAVPEPEVSADADVVNGTFFFSRSKYALVESLNSYCTEHELKLSALIDRISSLQQRLSTSAEKTKRCAESLTFSIVLFDLKFFFFTSDRVKPRLKKSPSLNNLTCFV
jgi:hypothetical protein